MVIKDLGDMKDRVEKIISEVEALPNEGAMPESLPHLSGVDPNKFAVGICTIDGQKINFGDSKDKVTMQSIAAVSSFIMAQEEIGPEELMKTTMSCEPSGKPYNNLELKDNKTPHNPMINSGALMNTISLWKKARSDRKFENYTEIIGKMIGKEKVSFNNEMCLAEMDSSHKNYCLLYMLQEGGLIGEGENIHSHMEFYSQTCNIELDIEEYAVLAATLANGGICPQTEERVFMETDAVKNCLSQMLTCGMNTYSGEWNFKISLPAKSG